MKSNLGDKERLGHILDCIAFIEKSTIDVSLEDFIGNYILNAAVSKWIELIGESAYKLTKDFKKENNEVPWHPIETLRHIIVHDYFSLDLDQIWIVVESRIPELKPQIENLYNNFKKED